MKTLSKITKNIRSKNAGPFWVTVDLFFKDRIVFFMLVKIYQMKKFQIF